MTGATLSQRLRVLVADDEPLMREAIASIIQDEPALNMIGAAEDPFSAIELAERLQPDVAVVDVRMPGGGGSEAARGIHQVSPGTAILALSASDDRDSVLRMLRAGAVGYLVKGTHADEVVESIVRAAERTPTMSAQATVHVVRKLSEDLQEEQQRLHQDLERETRVRRFLEDGGLHMVFQPILDLREQRIVGYEALARFGGEPAMRPDQWFAEAEVFGLRTELELHAISLAVAQLPFLPEDVYLAVNASPPTITHSELADRLGESTRNRIVVELTEHAPIADYPRMLEHIEVLRTIGVRLAVDDAGAGFSCLQHVLRLDPDIIKLDRAITDQVDSEPRHAALAAALVAFTRESNAHLVAEGIETESQLSALQRLGVPMGQGYLFGRPEPLAGATQSERLKR